jgi:hypothetical protein
MAEEHDAAEREREMREHEREARERNPEERRDKGGGAGDASADSPAPPGNVQEGTTTGS